MMRKIQCPRTGHPETAMIAPFHSRAMTDGML